MASDDRPDNMDAIQSTSLTADTHVGRSKGLRLDIPPSALQSNDQSLFRSSEDGVEQEQGLHAQADNKKVAWKKRILSRKTPREVRDGSVSSSDGEQEEKRPEKWSMGILNDRTTEEVPGSILLLSKVSEYNEPLGLRNAPARTSASSLPSPYTPGSMRSSIFRRRKVPEKKKTPDGKIVLEPQPDDSLNDPLNWAQWRRDLALLSLGFYCMLGGGMTAILAAGFNQIAHDFGIAHSRVALTTGLYMMGLGLGSVILSPTAILFGKRPVYLVAAVCFILSSVWCAVSPNFANLIVARIFMGLAASSVECLPSASVAEIYFLHEKAYRLGIYTLLLLGGKNLFPLISAAIIQSLGWRWVFWVIATIVGLGFVLLFLFVPETFWDRTPVPHRKGRFAKRSASIFRTSTELSRTKSAPTPAKKLTEKSEPRTPAKKHAHFATETDQEEGTGQTGPETLRPTVSEGSPIATRDYTVPGPEVDYFTSNQPASNDAEAARSPSIASTGPPTPGVSMPRNNAYTSSLLNKPPKTFIQSLRPYSGRLSHDNWFKVAVRPFILYAYPSILWSALVYSLSIGWLIVISESMSTIYQQRDSYNFTSFQTGLVYISPFVGGILGTAVAGKVSDVVVRAMARRNGGIYEPEFRLVMAIPITISTVIGLMGFGWSAEERDAWIVPTLFFGIVSFGCSLGSTTSITFAVDSYRQYAGEALVTLNFSKNVLHGLVFSLFFNNWLEAEGSKEVFICIGCIQLACLASTVPMYIYGKRARMWTVRKNLMEKF